MNEKAQDSRRTARSATTKRRARPGRKRDATDFDRLSQEQLARVHGVTSRTLMNWEPEGLPRNDDGTYSAAKTIRWRITRDLAGGISYEGERAKLMQARAQEAQLKAAAVRGELAPLPLIEQEFSKLLHEIKTNFLALPYMAAAEIAGHSAEDCQAMLMRKVREILDRVAQWRPEDAVKLHHAEARHAEKVEQSLSSEKTEDGKQ